MTHEEMKIAIEEYATKIPVERRREDGLTFPEDKKRADDFWTEVFEFIANNNVPTDLIDIIVPVV